jgi:hypothetical protein
MPPVGIASNTVTRDEASPVASPCQYGELVEIASNSPRS